MTASPYYLPSPAEIADCPGAWLFADAGVIPDGNGIHSRSTIGCTWAWIHLQDGKPVAADSGVLRPCEIGLESVTSNICELFALLNGMAKLPDGWEGVLCSDSIVTMGRVCFGHKLKGIPLSWLPYVARHRARFVGRAGVKFCHLSGHPSGPELAAGRSREGRPVSKWNVWCDEAATAAGAAHLATLAANLLEEKEEIP